MQEPNTADRSTIATDRVVPHASARSGGRGELAAGVRRAAPRLVGGGVLVYVLLTAAGLLLTRVLAASWLPRTDQSVSSWFSRHRTAELDTVTHYGSVLSDTPTAIILTILLMVGLRLWLRRWRESLAILISIMGELFLFLLVTNTVHRQRPSVAHLDPAPPTSSFPSGHVGAAVALYAGLAVVLLQATRAAARRWAVVAAVVLSTVPVIVAVSRVYRGMHFLSDVIAGALAGGLWTAIVLTTLLGARRRERSAL